MSSSPLALVACTGRLYWPLVLAMRHRARVVRTGWRTLARDVAGQQVERQRPRARHGHGVLSCSGISIAIVPSAGCDSLVAYFSQVGLIWPQVGLIWERAAVPGAPGPYGSVDGVAGSA